METYIAASILARPKTMTTCAVASMALRFKLKNLSSDVNTFKTQGHGNLCCVPHRYMARNKDNMHQNHDLHRQEEGTYHNS